MSWELIPTSGLDTASDRQRCEQTSYVTFLSRAIPLSGEVRTGTVGALSRRVSAWARTRASGFGAWCRLPWCVPGA